MSTVLPPPPPPPPPLDPQAASPSASARTMPATAIVRLLTENSLQGWFRGGILSRSADGRYGSNVGAFGPAGTTRPPRTVAVVQRAGAVRCSCAATAAR